MTKQRSVEPNDELDDGARAPAGAGQEGAAGVTADTAAETPAAGDAVDPDPAAEAGGEDDPGNLRAALDDAEARAKDYWERLLRTEAEKDNIRKRAQRDVESAHKYAVEKFAAEMLAVRDSLELGLEAADKEDADVAGIREGTQLTLRMLDQALEKFHVEEIDPLGEKFNPDLHQAMSMQEVEDQEPNTVTAVMQKGYRLNERLLRPALVMVAK